MYLADYHVHSNCSFDGQDPMALIAASAASYGINEICFTDHCDMISGELEITEEFDFEPIRQNYLHALMHHGLSVRIKLGLEIGNPLQNRALADELATKNDLDFVLGSVHVLPDKGDFYDIEYTSDRQCYRLVEQYLGELEALAEWGNFDVMAHITYPLRYMNGRGKKNISFELYYERLEMLFRKLIENGKGIELNVSGLRVPDGVTMPPMEILELYRRCGGEIITVGSDAHSAKHVGAGIARGCDLLMYAGFKYCTLFNQRQPEFIKLV